MEEFERHIRLDASSGSRGDSCGMPYRLAEFPTLTFWQMGDTSDISSLLARYKPRIVVDEDGGELLLCLSFTGSCLNFLSGGDRLWRDAPVPSYRDGSTTK